MREGQAPEESFCFLSFLSNLHVVQRQRKAPLLLSSFSSQHHDRYLQDTSLLEDFELIFGPWDWEDKLEALISLLEIPENKNLS